MSNEKQATIENILDLVGDEYKDATMRVMIEGLEGDLRIDGCCGGTGEENGKKYLVINISREDHDAFIAYNFKNKFGSLVMDLSEDSSEKTPH